MTTQSSEIEQMARQVEKHPDYRVLRRLVPRTTFPHQPSGPLARAAVVDTETTGIDPNADEIIEVGVVIFEFNPTTGYATRVLDSFDALEQPSRPIPPETTLIHGITDDMVAGKRIDDDQVARLLKGVTLVIAHNAAFDRKLLERRFPVFETLPWACSFKEVAWALEGIGSSKLDYILNSMGYFHEAHRAEADCLALLEILQTPLASTKAPALKQLVTSSKMASYRVWARNSPFDNKDRLKARGYRWEAQKKCWYLESSEETLAADLAALKLDGYSSKPAKIDLEKLDAAVRYSNRGGVLTPRNL